MRGYSFSTAYGCIAKSYRFAATDGVGQLAKAIQTADALRLLEVLDTADYASVSLNETQTGLELDWLKQAWQAYIQAVKANQLTEAFQAFNAYADFNTIT